MSRHNGRLDGSSDPSSGATDQSHDRSQSVPARINTHRDALEAIASSDLPAAWIAQTLLDIADDPGRDRGDKNGGDARP